MLTPEQVLELLCQLDSKVRGRLFFAAWKREEWWGKTRDVTAQARVPHRRGEIELAGLVADGFLVRREKGAKNQDRLVRFELGPAAIKLIGPVRSKRSERSDQNDRSATIETIAPLRSKRSEPIEDAHAHARAPDPDLSLDPRSMDNTVRPSGGVQGAEPSDGRTDGGEFEERLQRAIAWVQERQGISPKISTAGLTRLLNAGATDHELRAYAVEVQRGTHSCLKGVEKATFRFGPACTEERFAEWRASRTRPPRRGPSVSEQLEREPSGMPAPDEMSAIAELVKARLK